MKLENLKVSIIIPTFNTRDLLEKNLPSVVAAFKNPTNQVTEIIVVDDASPDDSYEFVKKHFPEVRLIRHKVNRGFAFSVNNGARMARGNLICLINSDVIPDKDFMVSVLPHFQNDDVFGVSLHERGFGWAKGIFKEGFVSHEPGVESPETHATFWVSGGSGVISREKWLELGGMDEKVFAPFYWEDIDLSYRAMKKGYKILWEPKAYVLHKHESTISRLSQSYVSRIRERNQLLFNWKNITSQNFMARHIAGLTKRVIAHPGYLRIVVMALFKLPRVISARKKAIKVSKISDEAIFARFKS